MLRLSNTVGDVILSASDGGDSGTGQWLVVGKDRELGMYTRRGLVAGSTR
jgi:hypothetical protein